MMRREEPGTARVARRCALMAAAISVFGTGSAHALDANWVPTGFDEHSRAAWAAIVVLCGPNMPEQASDPARADLCAQTYDVSLLYLQTLKAWAELPASDGGSIDMQVFPDFDTEFMGRIAAIAEGGEPDWEIIPNPDVARAPAVVRQSLIDAVTNSYGTMQRVVVAQALISEPSIILLDEPTANLDDPAATSVEAGAAATAADESGTSSDAVSDDAPVK